MATTLPPHVAAIAPKREDYKTEEGYREALEHFHHRVAGSTRRHSVASREK